MKTMFLTKLFRRSAFKVSTGLFVVGVALAAAGIFVLQTDILGAFIPENDTVLMGFLGFIGALFAVGIISATIRAHHLDHERQALQLVKRVLERDGKDYKQRLNTLLKGRVFQKAGLEGTDIARVFVLMARTKGLNPRFYVDTERLMRKLEKRLGDNLSGLAEGANSQTALGFMGTIVGLIISFSAFGGQEALATGGIAIADVMQGASFAMLTTLTGIIGGRLLRMVYTYLVQEAKVLLDGMEGVMASQVDPVLNDNATSGLMKVRYDPNMHGGGGAL